jgi:hypothetical protein
VKIESDLSETEIEALDRALRKLLNVGSFKQAGSGQFNALYCQLDGAVGFMKGHLHEGPL